jgi:hypothetical protein
MLEKASMGLLRRLCLAGALAGGACTRAEPPAPDGAPSVALPELVPPAPSAGTATAPSPAPAPISSSADSAASADPATLPQTRDQPLASGPAFEARVAALWAGIVNDDPDRALSFFFPLAAYQQVKDIGDPASDWKHRLVAAYSHDIHALHARLGTDSSSATFDRIEVPEPRARWVEPGEEYNKIGYFRVFGSKLRYVVGGAPRSFEIKSMISWRGEWFVVHLSAIK